MVICALDHLSPRGLVGLLPDSNHAQMNYFQTINTARHKSKYVRWKSRPDETTSSWKYFQIELFPDEITSRLNKIHMKLLPYLIPPQNNQPKELYYMVCKRVRVESREKWARNINRIWRGDDGSREQVKFKMPRGGAAFWIGILQRFGPGRH